MEYDILKYKNYWKEKAQKEKEKMELRRKSMISAIKKCASNFYANLINFWYIN